MDETTRYLRVYGPVLYLFFSFLIMVFSIAPLADWLSQLFPLTLFAITYALMLRQPIVVPIWIVGIVFLTRDFIYFQPIGIEAAIAVVIFYIVRNARKGLAETYLTEWGGFAISVFLLFTLKVLISWIFGVATQEIWLIAKSALCTIVIYPIVTGALSFQFGLVKQPQT